MYFGAEKDNTVTLLHSVKIKHAFTGKIQDVSKKIKSLEINKITV